MRCQASLTSLSLFVLAFNGTALAGSLEFKAEIPRPPATLPLLQLTQQPPPTQLLDQLLAPSTGGATLAPLADAPFIRRNGFKISTDMLGIVEGEHVRAWVNRRTGEAAVYPSLDKAAPMTEGEVNRLTSRAQDVFKSPEFFPGDDTRVSIEGPNILSGETLVRDPNGNTRIERQRAAYLAYFAARRFVGDFRVDGPGSRATLALDGGGSVQGMVRVWKSAKTVSNLQPRLRPEQVQAEIARQLRPALVDSDVVVDRVELAYYDANGRFLQPVYRFTAQVHHITMPRTPARTADDFIIGYIPFATAAEPLPELGRNEGPQPRTASEARPSKPIVPAPRRAPARPQGGPALRDPIVGRYVVRNDDAGWVNNANGFWNGLASTWTSNLFTNAQYYWAEPRLFTIEKNTFVNAVNLALFEAHGDWWLTSTLKNCCDLVNINGDIPSPGYGPSANGSLADWVIHSCEVVPAPDDTANWPDPWWTVFGGVRNILGYRTIMYINDSAGAPYGTSLGNLAPVVSAWLNDVMSLNAYSGHPSATAHGNISRPMGRPSSISMCGHDGDSVLSTSPLGRAGCLTVWWFPD